MKKKSCSQAYISIQSLLPYKKHGFYLDHWLVLKWLIIGICVTPQMLGQEVSGKLSKIRRQILVVSLNERELPGSKRKSPITSLQVFCFSDKMKHVSVQSCTLCLLWLNPRYLSYWSLFRKCNIMVSPVLQKWRKKTKRLDVYSSIMPIIIEQL